MYKKFYPCINPTNTSLLSLVGFFSKLNTTKVFDDIESDNEEEKTNKAWKRLKAMYSYDKEGSISPELAFVSSLLF